MKLALTFFLCIVAGHSNEADWYAKWSQGGNTWREKWLNLADTSEMMTAADKYEMLRQGLGVGLKETMNADEQEVYLRIRRILLNTPGYGEYYRAKILDARAKLDQAKEVDGPVRIAERRDDLTQAQAGFGMLRHLPSAESVGMLGEFLNDERGWEKLSHNASSEERENAKMEVPNCQSALFALNSMGIVSKPYRPHRAHTLFDEELPSALAAWRIWYEQIKSGNRTFRFEGDPVEYDLNGPAPKEKLVRIERDRKRDAERLAGAKRNFPSGDTVPGRSGVSNPVSIAGLLAALVLCLSAGWYFLRGRKTA